MRGFCLILTFMCGWIWAASGAESDATHWRKALELSVMDSGGSLSEMHIDPNRIQFSSSGELLPFHELLVSDPLAAPEAVRLMAKNFVRAPYAFPFQLVNASIFINRRIGTAQFHNWAKAEPTAELWLEALAALAQMDDQKVGGEEMQRWKEDWRQLPLPLQRILYEFAQSLRRAYPWLKAGRESIKAIAPLYQVEAVFLTAEPSPEQIQLWEKVHRDGDLKSIFHAGMGISDFLLHCAADAKIWEITEEIKPSILRLPLGDVVIAGEGQDEHAHESAPLLLIDLGGDDAYQGRYSLADHSLPVSITLDLGGSDVYRSDSESQGNGSSYMGFSALLDLGPGDDRYEGKVNCFGYSLAGTAIVYDASGETLMQAESRALGASDMGIALLVDGEGDDSYTSYNSSQGYGSSGGIGMLIDSAGSDKYIAPATPVLITSPQLPQQNFSGSQGFGVGRFGPFSDGHNLPGGIGMLIDGAGDDTYEASVFAQGAGYGFGMGFLVDLGGDDRYKASWYAMGTAAHSACGMLLDATGNDRYEASHYMIGGAGVDLSLAVLMDEAGDDVYQAQNASLGYGLENAFALFVDQAGNDDYRIQNQLGCGVAKNERFNTLRMLWPTFGLFMDDGGVDTYPAASQGDNTTWNGVNPEYHLWGLGMDQN